MKAEQVTPPDRPEHECVPQALIRSVGLGQLLRHGKPEVRKVALRRAGFPTQVRGCSEPKSAASENRNERSHRAPN